MKLVNINKITQLIIDFLLGHFLANFFRLFIFSQIRLLFDQKALITHHLLVILFDLSGVSFLPQKIPRFRHVLFLVFLFFKVLKLFLRQFSGTSLVRLINWFYLRLLSGLDLIILLRLNRSILLENQMVIADRLLVLNYCLFVFVSGQHQLVSLFALLTHSLLDLLNPISVPEGVKSSLGGLNARRDVSYHYSETVSNERLLKNHSQFASSERKVLLGRVQGPDALLEGQEWLVDLSSILSSLLVGLLDITSSLVSGQIDETNLTNFFPSFHVSDRNLKNSMGPRRVLIHPSLSDHSIGQSLFGQFDQTFVI